MYRSILYRSENKVARITLNRPEKRNALNRDTIGELQTVFSEAAVDGEINAVVLNGAGVDFCSGADLSALKVTSELSVLENLKDAGQMGSLFRAMRELPKPIVAAVHGRALAGGCGLATACDIVLAAESAQFGYPEVNIGFIPAMVMAILRRSVSEKTAFEMIATGAIVSAPRAFELGLVQQVFDDSEFETRSIAYAEKLASKPASAVMLSKRLLYHMDGMSFDAALEAGVQANAIARMTDECRAGIQQFLDKAANQRK
jgi:methylglutaconyl-CoA hydratase